MQGEDNGQKLTARALAPGDITSFSFSSLRSTFTPSSFSFTSSSVAPLVDAFIEYAEKAGELSGLGSNEFGEFEVSG